MLATAQGAAIDDLAGKLAVFLLQHFEVHQAIIHRDNAADFDNVHQLRVVHVYGALLHKLTVANAQGHHVAGVEFHRVIQHTGTDFRTLGIQQNRDRIIHLPVERFDPVDDLESTGMVRVRHVDSHDVHASFVEGFEPVEARGSRPDGANNLGASFHARSLIACTG